MESSGEKMNECFYRGTYYPTQEEFFAAVKRFENSPISNFTAREQMDAAREMLIMNLCIFGIDKLTNQEFNGLLDRAIIRLICDLRSAAKVKVEAETKKNE